ncbi:MAG: SWIM zinc finger family protein [Acidimicrobiia bacterium]|nr:SWIM zinc finger family protein [Acidimicrobiia bacterium]
MVARRGHGDLPEGVDLPADHDDPEASAAYGARARRLDTPRASDVDEGAASDEMRVTPWRGWERFVHTGAIPVADGIRAKTRRGRIGTSWWSQRFMSVIESLELGGRLDRARTYARKGQVIDLEVDPGTISAHVQGTSPTPYVVEIRLRRLGPGDWERVVEAMASRAAFAAHLLSGEMPVDVEAAFAGADVSLFPVSADELAMSCTCPDWSVPCKHVAAVLYLLAEALDTDPFLLMLWRGMTKEDLLAAIRAARGDTGGAGGGGQAVRTLEASPLGDRLDDFWEGSDVRLVHHAPEVAPDVVVFARSTVPGAAPLRQLVEMQVYARIVRNAARSARRIGYGGGEGGAPDAVH